MYPEAAEKMACELKAAVVRAPVPQVGTDVLFNEEGGPYAAKVTATNKDGTVDLVTFGRNSVYFQHNVPYAFQGYKGTYRYAHDA